MKVKRSWHFWWAIPIRFTDIITYFMIHKGWYVLDLWYKSDCLLCSSLIDVKRIKKQYRGIWSNNQAFEGSIPSEPSDGALPKECLCSVKSSQIWALQHTASVQNASYFHPIICGQFCIRKCSTHGASQTSWTPRSFTLPQIKLDQPLQKQDKS